MSEHYSVKTPAFIDIKLSSSYKVSRVMNVPILHNVFKTDFY